MNALDEKMPSWFYEFADAVAALTMDMLKTQELDADQMLAVGEAVHEAVLTSLHDSPINEDEGQ
jgi:hypothetical protein